MVPYIIDNLIYWSILFGFLILLRLLFQFFSKSFADPQHLLNMWPTQVLLLILFYFFGEAIGFYIHIDFWKPLQGYFFNEMIHLDRYTTFFSGLVAFFSITFLYYSKRLWLICLSLRETRLFLATLFFFLSLPLYYGFISFYFFLESLLLITILALMYLLSKGFSWKTLQNTQAFKAFQKCLKRPKKTYQADLLVVLAYSFAFWTVIGGICYAPFYLDDKGFLEVQPSLNVRWDLKFCPRECNLCFEQIKKIEQDYRWQENFPKPLMKVWNYYCHTKILPDHYHTFPDLWPCGFNGYGLFTPEGMENPGGANLSEVWGSNLVVTPQTALIVGPLKDPIYFKELPPGAKGFKFYPKHCSKCLGEVAIVLNQGDLVEQAKADYLLCQEDISWEDFWQDYYTKTLSKAVCTHYHIWDYQKPPKDFPGYGILQPPAIRDPYGITVEAVWGSKENVISRLYFMANSGHAPDVTPYFYLSLAEDIENFKATYTPYLGPFVISLICIFVFWAPIVFHNLCSKQLSEISSNKGESYPTKDIHQQETKEQETKEQ